MKPNLDSVSKHFTTKVHFNAYLFCLQAGYLGDEKDFYKCPAFEMDTGGETFLFQGNIRIMCTDKSQVSIRFSFVKLITFEIYVLSFVQRRFCL